MIGKTTYADANDDGHGYFKVIFRDNKTQALLKRSFDSKYFCGKFVNKLKRSKDCTLISYPILHP